MPKPKSAPTPKQLATKRLVAKPSVKVRVVKLSSPLTAPPPSIYSVHPGVLMVQKWMAEMKAKTGRSVPEWVKHIRAAGPETEQQCRDWLKAQYEFGTNTAGWLAEKAFGKPLGMADETPEKYLAAAPKYVDQMYAGAKQNLRPLHDRLIELARTLGDGLRICPCKTIVPLYRRHVFAEIKPATQTRLVLGFALQDEPFTARLLDTSGQQQRNRITHKVAITKLSDIDLQVRRWLKQAFELDA